MEVGDNNITLTAIQEGLVSGRRALEWLETTGTYVFHGSDSETIAALEPRQAFSVERGSQNMIADGDPAVCASNSADVAIFRSLISSSLDKTAGLRHQSSFGCSGGVYFFKVSQISLDAARGRTGYVYVMPKSKFEDHSSLEVRTKEKVAPILIVPVHFEDLPKNIEILK